MSLIRCRNSSKEGIGGEDGVTSRERGDLHENAILTTIWL